MQQFLNSHIKTPLFWYWKLVAKRTEKNQTESKEECKHPKWWKHPSFANWNTSFFFFFLQILWTDEPMLQLKCSQWRICSAAFASFHVNTQCLQNDLRQHRNARKIIQATSIFMSVSKPVSIAQKWKQTSANANYSMITKEKKAIDMHIQYQYYVQTFGHPSQLLRTLNCTIYLL